MNKERLFEHLENEDQSILLELLSSAFDEMDTDQRHDVFGEIIREEPVSPVEGKKLLSAIRQFYKKSMEGHYYAPFNINSKNFMDIPEETNAWFDETGDFLEDSSSLSDQGDHKTAVQCFNMLYELIDEMEDGGEIVFADEYGTWMITGDEKRFIKSYLSSLSAISNPEEYADGAILLIIRDSHESFHNKVYSTATKIANEDQKAYLKKEVKKRKVKTKSK